MEKFKVLTQEPISLFNIFNFDEWPPESSEHLETYGDDDLDKLLHHFRKVLTDEQIEEAKEAWSDVNRMIQATPNTTFTLMFCAELRSLIWRTFLR